MDAFFAGEPVAVKPGEAERELAALWLPAAEGLGDDEAPLTRVSLGTQVLVAPAERAERLGGLWAEIGTRHPSRIVLVVLRPNRHPVSAAIGATCHLPAPGQPQVCSERVRLELGADDLDRLPALLLPLLEPDVPATIWWEPAEPPSDAVRDDLCRQADRLLTDLTLHPAPGELWRGLARPDQPTVADLAWYRAGWWREGTARLFDGGQAGQAAVVNAMQVTTAAGDGPGELLPAALLAGWAARQLGWSPRRLLGVERSEWRRTDGRPAEIELDRVAVGAGRAGRLQSFRLNGPSPADCWWRLERLHDNPRELRVEAHHADWCRLPARLPAPRPEPAEVLLAALAGATTNAVRDGALANAAWMMGWAD